MLLGSYHLSKQSYYNWKHINLSIFLCISQYKMFAMIQYNLVNVSIHTNTPSLISSTSIGNFVPPLVCLDWFPIPDLQLPPLENNKPSSLSTSLLQKMKKNQVREMPNITWEKKNKIKWIIPSISSGFHCAQLIFLLGEYIHWLWSVSPRIGI